MRDAYGQWRAFYALMGVWPDIKEDVVLQANISKGYRLGGELDEIVLEISDLSSLLIIIKLLNYVK